MAEDKRVKVKKGWLAVRVGVEEEEVDLKRFEMPINYLYHPLFKNLLDIAQEVYGYHGSGPLRLLCSVDEYLHLRWLIDRESHHSRSHHHHHRTRRQASFSLSC